MAQLQQGFATAEWGSETKLQGNNLELRMSALGHKRTFHDVQPMSALAPTTDIGTRSRNVRFVPKADIGLLTRSSARTAG
jgi:hypothetical protein